MAYLSITLSDKMMELYKMHNDAFGELCHIASCQKNAGVL